jgi:hypothetical protein
MTHDYKRHGATTLFAALYSGNKTAEEITAKVRRGRAALTRVTKSATDH